MTQVYQNHSSSPVETEYLFPVNDLGVFSKFKAIFKNRVVHGQIKEKEKAKKEFKEGVEQGHMMGYGAIEEKTPDIMKIKLGNLPANETVTIVLEYL